MLSNQDLPQDDCMFCGEQKQHGLAVMMNEALIAKHASSQSDQYLSYIDVLMKLEEPCNPYEAWAAYQHKEYEVIDEHDEFLKREYAADEFGTKICMLTEYYKFHVDLPKVVERSIEKILGKYYDKKREFDYKKIKKILKQEQGLSITSVQGSESSLNGSIVSKRSRYSTLLDQLQESKANEEGQMSDSKLLKDLCKVIEKALPSRKNDNRFQLKGSFSHHRIFEEFLKKEERKTKPKLRVRDRGSEANPSRRIDFQQLLRRRETGRRQLQKSKEKDSNVRDSREARKKEKDGKFVYNTNIKIEIKNAMFYSQGQNQPPPFNIGNTEYASGSKHDSLFRKKNLINQVNYLNQDTNKKLVSQIYKSTNHDLKRRLQSGSSHQRLTTKESVNRSQSKIRKESISRQNSKDLKKGGSGASSARKLVYANNEWVITNSNSSSKPPSRSTSASNLKKRSHSSKANGGVSASAACLPRKNQKMLPRRAIESIPKYGSPDIKTLHNDAHLQQRERRAVSIREVLNRKLTFKQN